MVCRTLLCDFLNGKGLTMPQTRRRFIGTGLGMLAGAIAATPGTDASLLAESDPDYEYSCIWMTRDEIEREIIVSPGLLDRHAPCWLATLECKVDGTYYYCCQLIDDIGDEPKVKEAFLRSMRRTIAGGGKPRG